MGAKVLSKIAMVFAGVWIIILTLLKGFGKIDLSINEIIGSGVAVAAVWTPTYFSIIVDKFVGKEKNEAISESTVSGDSDNLR